MNEHRLKFHCCGYVSVVCRCRGGGGVCCSVRSNSVVLFSEILETCKKTTKNPDKEAGVRLEFRTTVLCDRVRRSMFRGDSSLTDRGVERHATIAL
jgi:hypothetical protein